MGLNIQKQRTTTTYNQRRVAVEEHLVKLALAVLCAIDVRKVDDAVPGRHARRARLRVRRGDGSHALHLGRPVV